MDNKEQQLLAQVLELFSQEFGKKAVLRGGMVLKILGSPRFTNDLDYVFVPYRSKNDIAKQVLNCLRKIQNAKVSHTLNSQCLRVVLAVGESSIQIEAKVAKSIKTDIATTSLFSPQFNLPKRVIHVVDHTISMANKLAAWNERRLIRDLYDVWFFLQMNISPDLHLLSQRLKKPIYSKAVKKVDYFKGKNVHEFYEFLRASLSKISNKEIESQLSDYLLPDEIIGLLSFFKAAFVKLSDPDLTPI